MNQINKPILLTGATGYIGSELLRALERRGLPVRCLVRHPEQFTRTIAPGTEIVRGDVLQPETLPAALAGTSVAFYLVHSMNGRQSFAEADRRAATHFAAAARAAGVERIIYIGGLGQGSKLSAHMASRQETGQILRDSGVPTVELRASVVIGAGSISFEMIRALVERLPVMVTPKWVGVTAQPIAISDLIDYMQQAMTIPLAGNAIYEIGGSDRASYQAIMQQYAAIRKLRRWMIRVPVLTPHLSSLWLELVTPLYARVGRKLINSICNESIVCDRSAEGVFSVRPMGLGDAITRALKDEDLAWQARRWSHEFPHDMLCTRWGGIRKDGRIVESHAIHVSASPAEAFAPILRMGGRNGWPCGDWLWQIRGLLDQLVGGPGMRRGRRDPENLAVGDHLDFWRVEVMEPGRTLRLHAEMKVPGRAWLQFEVTPVADGSIVRQTAIFDSVGVLGLLYWYVLYPIHRPLFRGMLRALAKQTMAAKSATSCAPGPG